MKRYIKFLVSILVMSLGICLVTKSGLGTSANSSIAFVLSNIFSVSFGFCTMLFNTGCVIVQILILRRDFPPKQYLQFLVGPFLGGCIDLWMFIMDQLIIDQYVFKIIMIIIGCIVLGLGITIQLSSKVVNNPMEGLVLVYSKKTGIEFSKTKVIFDTSMVMFSMIISFVYLETFVGIGEGTILTMLFVGTTVHYLMPAT